MDSAQLKELFKAERYQAIRGHIKGDEWVDLIQKLADEVAKEELTRREEYLQAIVEMQRELLSTRSVDLGALNGVLKPLGLASRASRVYLFENHSDEQGRLRMSQRAEWCAQGVEPELDNPELQNLSYDDFFPRWSEMLGSGQNIQGRIESFPPEEREILEPQGILSMLVIPLMIEQSFRGFIGFDDCVEARIWGDLEHNLLMTAASNISLALDQRRAECDLREVNRKLSIARDEARQASKIKSTFLAKISHELRTPLNAVIGYSELLLEDMSFVQQDDTSLEKSKHDVEHILKSGRHLLLMVNDLLDLSRIEASGVKLHVETFDLQEFIRDTTTMLRPTTEMTRNRFEVQLDPELGMLRTDRKAMTQILINLLSNAFKYTDEGTISLSVRTMGADMYGVDVEDTGEGMTPEALGRVFNAFVQADDSSTRVHEGVGLGLAITRRLCDTLHIELNVESVKHQGTKFSLLVPRVLNLEPDL